MTSSSPTTIPSPSPLAAGRTGNNDKKHTCVVSENGNRASKSSPPVPSPKLRLHIEDLTHDGAKAFINLVPDPNATLNKALSMIVMYLYTPPSESKAIPGSKDGLVRFTPSLPPTRSVTFILRDFSGVAFAKGTDLDNDHKEIHFSLSYIKTSSTLEKAAQELAGVLTHELVHCYQHSTPPGSKSIPRPPSGLIEGIADFVRLRAGLAPSHWKRPTRSSERAESWDQGYQHTAFFLEWIEDVAIGVGAVGLINDRLSTHGYVGETGSKNEGKDIPENSNAESFWKGLFGDGVLELWEAYGRYLDQPRKEIR